MIPIKRDMEKNDGIRKYQKLGVDWIGSHTMRKTGAFIIYEQTGHDIGFVSNLLNHSSEAMTFRYLGFEEERKEALLDQINFNKF